MSDSELRSTLQSLQDQIDALESLNQPTPPPTTDNLLYYKNAISELAWLGIGSGLQINNGLLTVNLASGGSISVAYNSITGIPVSIDALDSLTPAADKLPYFDSSSTAALADLSSFARTILDDANAAAVRTTISAQALDATLTALAGLSTSADQTIYSTGADSFAMTTLSAFGRTLIDDADASAARTTLGIAIGSNVQAYDTELAQIAALSNPAADRILFYDVSGGGYAHLQMGTNISISGTTLNVSSGTATLGDGDYGDITVTVGGTVMTVDNDTITYAKMQNVSAQYRLLGRSSVGAGDPEEITTSAFILTLLDDAAASNARTTLGLVIGTDVQAYDAELAALAGLTSAADRLPYFTGSGTAALATFTAAGRAIVDDADASAQRTTLGLVIGTDVQAYDAELAAIAGLTSAADRLPYFTGSGTAALATFTAAGRALVDDADAAAQRTTLGLVIGTNVQAYLAGNTTVAIPFIIDGGGSTITTGVKGDLTIPFACTITEASLLADQSGSIVIDIWKDTYANYPPTVADTIVASAKPTISSATKAKDTTLTGWTKTIAAGDTLRFNVDSVTTLTRVTLTLVATKT